MVRSVASANEFLIENEVLVKYNGTHTTVTILEDVKKIGKGAFKDSQIEEVIFASNSLKSIEDDAFKGCKKLEFIELPDGLITVGKNAFYGCSALRCTYVPSSVLVLEKDAFDLCAFDFYIIGSKGSEAEQLATSKCFGFKTNKTDALSIFRSAKKKRDELATRTFEFLGEEIVCSNSLPLYDKVIKYYAGVREKFIAEIESVLPKDINGKVNTDLQELLYNLIDRTLKSLANEGIVIDKSFACHAVMTNYEKLCENISIVVEKIKSIRETISENIESKIKDLNVEINSKVTGVSYGVIGSSLDVLIHSIADAEAAAEQRSKATTVAKKELATYKEEQAKKGEHIYEEELKKRLPLISDIAKDIVGDLMNWELTTLSNSGLLDLESTRSLDYEKSIELLNSSKSRGKDEGAILALAIKKFPYNIAAIKRAISKQYESQGLQDLVDFLDIEEIKSERPESRYSRAIDLMNQAQDHVSYEEVAAIFNDLKGYKDSDHLASVCFEKSKQFKESFRNDEKYNIAKRYANSKDPKSLKEAIKYFRSISGWKKSDELCAECEKLMADIVEKERKEKHKIARKSLESAVTEKDFTEAIKLFKEIKIEIKVVTVFGKDIDEVREKAGVALGTTKLDCIKIEIIDSGSKGIFGIGKRSMQARAYIETKQ